MVTIRDPNDELPKVGDKVRSEGHYTSPAVNVPKEHFEKEELEYEPMYEGEVTDRFFEDGSVLIRIRITETEDADFLEVGDTVPIDEKLIREKDYFEVKSGESP